MRAIKHSYIKVIMILICVLLTGVITPTTLAQHDKTQLIPTFDSHQNNRPTIASFTQENIIITPPEFYTTAQQLQTFHSTQGIPTAIINTTTIKTHYPEAPDPPYYGYANRIIPRLFIKNYDYALAKCIIQFLRDTQAHPNTTYITLLGDGTHIPASYYIYSQARMTKRILLFHLPDFYNNIIATDYFYASPDYDLYPNYKIGRLPASTQAEAEHMITKIITWQENVDFDWFQNVYVAGDQPNLPEEMSLTGCYAGEMIAVDAINQNYFQHMTISKLFYTENKFTKQTILAAIEQGNSGFIYMMAHGFVDRWGTYNEPDPFIYADDIQALPSNNKLPIIVSVACMCGAYDTTQLKPYNLQYGTTSLGESFLLSSGGGIAYVGTTRATLGSPLLHLHKGKVVITKERGIAGMLTNFFKYYHEGQNIIGDIIYQSIYQYVIDNPFTAHPEKTQEFAVLTSLVLLGDPLLELPLPRSQMIQPSYKQPEIAPINPSGYTTEEYSRPWYHINTDITLYIETDSPEVIIKLINIDNDQVILRDRITTINGMAHYTFSVPDIADYLFRAETLDGKESWFYFSAF